MNALSRSTAQNRQPVEPLALTASAHAEAHLAPGPQVWPLVPSHSAASRHSVPSAVLFDRLRPAGVAAAVAGRADGDAFARGVGCRWRGVSNCRCAVLRRRLRLATRRLRNAGGHGHAARPAAQALPDHGGAQALRYHPHPVLK